LLYYDLDQGFRYTLLLVPFYQSKEVFAEWFKDNADMGGFRALMRERVEKGDNVWST
jgi:hypothetical protein